MKNKNIKDHVYKFKTKYKEGFTYNEIKKILKSYPKIDKKSFNNALIGITCMARNNETIIYHCDIEKAIYCGLEKRTINSFEWD